MPMLSSELRNKLERVVIAARDAAEAGARASLEAVAVHYHEPYPHMNPAQRSLRNHLRARARQLGDRQDSAGRLAIDHLVGECAYEHWHRMLFARFLAENSLLIEPQENMAISLAEVEELAKESGVDVWVFASRCAQRMLPQIFRPDDPLLQVAFATEHVLKLEKLLASLPQAVFTASDALGWVYQFWQSKKKDEVNRSEVKIGADEIAAVTQLFTEPYMVDFLLHNTLGAWWAGRKLEPKDAATAKTEDELRCKLALTDVGWEYLRFVRGADCKGGQWRPAAGTFDSWPRTAAEIKVLDPCCGSGHFLVTALHHLVPIRMAEEGLPAAQAVDAVLRDNLYGLEIDERCCQIAAFALAFAAWTYPNAGGFRPLPELNIACTGIGPQATEDQWKELAKQSGMPAGAEERERVKNGLVNLHRLFSQASILGSLINPADISADVFSADYESIQPYLAAILAAEKADDETRERAIAAVGMVKAADLLASKYTLVITNVPYLGRTKQNGVLMAYIDHHYAEGKADLATAFVLRCLEFCGRSGTAAIVTPQNWLFQTTSIKLREELLVQRQWDIVVWLGEHAFESGAAAGAFPAMVILSAMAAGVGHVMAGIEVSAPRGKRPIYPAEKALLLRGDIKAAEEAAKLTDSRGRQLDDADGSVRNLLQLKQLNHPDSRITLATEPTGDYLFAYADCYQGVKTGDNDRLCVRHWEFAEIHEPWRLMQSSPSRRCNFDGCSDLINWHYDGAMMARLQGLEAIGRNGLGIGGMSSLPSCFFLGQHFDSAIVPIIPKDQSNLPAIAAFCFDPAYPKAVRQIDKKVAVTTATLLKVPFDVAHWKKVAAERYPNGLPEPESDDPTQWLFHGRPEESTAPLQVAVARLLGYRWPAEFDEKMRLSKRARELVKRCEELAGFTDDDGIVCIPSVRGEEPAAERLLALLTAAGVKPASIQELAGGADLDDWLRNGFFEEHCNLFHDRPFIWHIWDGRKRDGFHALVNYHKFCEGGSKGRMLLESLTYSYLGEWITRQKDGVQRGDGGAEDRLAAAIDLKKRLEAILEGAPPFDLFVRWKPLAKQPIGWEPDINDGVRLNIRPFLANDLPTGRTGAGVLRFKPNIKWTKDRGKESERPKVEFPWFWGWDGTTVDFMGGRTFDGNRHNDCHYTNKAKQAARGAAKGAKRV